MAGMVLNGVLKGNAQQSSEELYYILAGVRQKPKLVMVTGSATQRHANLKSAGPTVAPCSRSSLNAYKKEEDPYHEAEPHIAAAHPSMGSLLL